MRGIGPILRSLFSLFFPAFSPIGMRRRIVYRKAVSRVPAL